MYVDIIDPVLMFSRLCASVYALVCVGWIISEGKHNAVIDISSTRCFLSPTAAQTGCARLNPDVEAPQRIVLSPPTNDRFCWRYRLLRDRTAWSRASDPV